MKKVLVLFIFLLFASCSSELSYITKIYKDGVEIAEVKTCNYPDINYTPTLMYIYDRCPYAGNLIFSTPYDNKITFKIEVDKIKNK